MSVLDNCFTFITALMFLAMYYNFASNANGGKRPKDEKKRSFRVPRTSKSLHQEVPESDTIEPSSHSPFQ